MSDDGGRWYTGTANAIYENIDFIDDLNPKHVLILSGDHIYKMDYAMLLKKHEANHADVTLAVMRVPWEETHRFGIINVDKDNKIIEFDEKPENPKNNMASMGIYMFEWDSLRKYLLKDNDNKDSSHDFGKDLLPLMLLEGKAMYAWNFDGYWKDVGTVNSYWQSNMDLLDKDNTLGLYDRSWRIYTRNMNLPPQYIGNEAIVKNSLINEGCFIEGAIENSILSSGVIVEKGAKITNSVILPNCIIKTGALVNKAVVLENVIINPYKKIGLEEKGIYLVDQDTITIE